MSHAAVDPALHAYNPSSESLGPNLSWLVAAQVIFNLWLRLREAGNTDDQAVDAVAAKRVDAVS